MPVAQGETLIAVAAPTGTTQIWSTNSKGCKTLIREQQTNSLTPLIFFFIFFPAIAFTAQQSGAALTATAPKHDTPARSDYTFTERERDRGRGRGRVRGRGRTTGGRGQGPPNTSP
ncbi:hypothetical protein E3N88_09546 [Mikania micrantha]|uniref:Uncharacterized protein n=1 Tax=Mikania micrantha TaxID=192012 RepID=A0A5N6PJC4_9ASTR|nr:hypothetical protein E3N88_09546 [Mikania micrantha]